MPAERASSPEQRLLREIGDLADRVRALRASPAPRDHSTIKTLEEQARAKWQALRSMRGSASSHDGPELRPGSLYR
jgi:hypothetical protein